MELNSDIFIKSENEIPADDNQHMLTLPVRKVYLERVKKLLFQNYKMNAQESPDSFDNILRLAENIEQEAAIKSVIVPLYRKQIIGMMNVIKHYTALNRLYPCPQVYLTETKSKVDKITQTELVQNNTNYDNTIDMEMYDKYKVADIKPKLDIVDLKVEEMFHNHSPNDRFVDPTNRNPLNLIMNETNLDDEDELRLRQLTNNSESAVACNNVKIEIVEDTSPQFKSIHSNWRCEEYFQKKFLYQELMKIADASPILNQKVQDKYVNLFGYESEEEIMQSPIKPSNLLRKCRKRIEPWVKCHMEHFFIQYNVASHLNIPLMKYLIFKCIQVNPYPSDYEVFVFVKEYFERKGHKRTKNKIEF